MHTHTIQYIYGQRVIISRHEFSYTSWVKKLYECVKLCAYLHSISFVNEQYLMCLSGGNICTVLP